MQEIPKWIFKVIEMEDLKCRECKKIFTSDNLMSISIQESSHPPHRDFLCIGLFCKKCKELMIFELKEMSLVEFASDIVDQEISNNIEKKVKNKMPAITGDSNGTSTKKRRKKSKITLKEINEIKKFLKPKNLTQEELLIAMGMSPVEIEQYNFKKEEPDKND